MEEKKEVVTTEVLSLFDGSNPKHYIRSSWGLMGNRGIFISFRKKTDDKWNYVGGTFLSFDTIPKVIQVMQSLRDAERSNNNIDISATLTGTKSTLKIIVKKVNGEVSIGMINSPTDDDTQYKDVKFQVTSKSKVELETQSGTETVGVESTLLHIIVALKGILSKNSLYQNHMRKVYGKGAVAGGEDVSDVVDTDDEFPF